MAPIVRGGLAAALAALLIAPAAQAADRALAGAAPTGLVGAWGFDEASGTTATDSSGAGNPGTVSGATWVAGGRYGGALSFDGVDDLVTVTDADSLDLHTGMTLEAWVRPTAGGDWRTVILKEQPGRLAYALYASTDNNRPSGHVFTTADRALGGPAVLPANAWSHLAMAWDGLTLRLYLNGAQVASSALTGAGVASGAPLRIGGNTVWGEWFAGLIDEVRVYDRALTGAEIAGDRDTAIGGSPGRLATRRGPGAGSKTAALGRRLTRDGAGQRVHRVQWLKKRARRAGNVAVRRGRVVSDRHGRVVSDRHGRVVSDRRGRVVSDRRRP